MHTTTSKAEPRPFSPTPAEMHPSQLQKCSKNASSEDVTKEEMPHDFKPSIGVEQRDKGTVSPTHETVPWAQSSWRLSSNLARAACCTEFSEPLTSTESTSVSDSSGSSRTLNWLLTM